MSEVTVVIPSRKTRQHTLELNPWLRKYHIIILHNSMGIAPAFNEAARHVKRGVMVMLADDILVDPQVEQYFNVAKGEFCMLDTGAFPANGVHIIRIDDFWRVGGFNEQYRYGSVDNEFYARAVLCGLKFKALPMTLVKHVRHETRASTVYKMFRVLRDRAMFVTTYIRYFPLQVLKHDYVFRLMRGQLRTVILNLAFLFAEVARTVLVDVWERMYEVVELKEWNIQV